MEFSKSFKIIWWVVSEVLIGCVLFFRRNYMLQAEPSSFDLSLIIIFIGLMIIPIFSELEIFGFKLKNEINSVKSDVETLNTKISSYIMMQSTNQQTMNLNSYISDEKFDELREEVVNALNQMTNEYKNDEPVRNLIKVSEDVKYLFAVRYNIEYYIRNIALRVGIIDEKSNRITPINKLLMKLSSLGHINQDLSKSVLDVYRICSPAVHGEKIDKEKVDFVKSISEDMLRYLDAVNDFA